MLGFALITVLTGTAYGCMETVMIKAARYFSGHVSVTGYLKKDAYIENPDSFNFIYKRITSSFKEYIKTDHLYRKGGKALFRRQFCQTQKTGRY